MAHDEPKGYECRGKGERRNGSKVRILAGSGRTIWLLQLNYIGWNVASVLKIRAHLRLTPNDFIR
jgi:hypothetical protein